LCWGGGGGGCPPPFLCPPRFVDQMKFGCRVERVVSTRVSLKCAGWLPQDGTFESELASGSRVERHQLWDNVIAHSRIAGHSRTLAAPSALFIWTIVAGLAGHGCQ
jgi:hypothetical protein